MDRPDEGNRHISQFLLTCQLKFTFDDQQHFPGAHTKYSNCKKEHLICIERHKFDLRGVIFWNTPFLKKMLQPISCGVSYYALQNTGIS